MRITLQPLASLNVYLGKIQEPDLIGCPDDRSKLSTESALFELYSERLTDSILMQSFGGEFIHKLQCFHLVEVRPRRNTGSSRVHARGGGRDSLFCSCQ